MLYLDFLYLICASISISSDFFKVRPIYVFMFYVIAFYVPLPLHFHGHNFADTDHSSLSGFVSICRILAYTVPIIWPVPFPFWTFFPEEGRCGTLSQELPNHPYVLSLGRRVGRTRLESSYRALGSTPDPPTISITS